MRTPNYSGLPEHMQESVQAYVEDGRPMGDFLTLIFANDFVHALGHADLINQHAAFAYAKFLYNEVPRTCWGSHEAVREWMQVRGLRGLGMMEEAT